MGSPVIELNRRYQCVIYYCYQAYNRNQLQQLQYNILYATTNMKKMYN